MPETTTTTLTPHLCCRNAVEAVAFYQRAFGAETVSIQQVPDGRVLHAALSIRGAAFYLVDAFPEHGARSPQDLGGSPVTLPRRTTRVTGTIWS